ncbi:MAG TPA: hypothetical protein VER58_05320 [Thermoanaerobaculia bacterium]|nr:hypothetical protein [Thermoanaerobaculia bacterium]
MRKLSLVPLILVSSVALAQPARKVDEISRRALDVLGGGPAYDKARYISFTFNVERFGKVVSSFPQQLDRSTGQYRVSGKTEDNLPFDITVNIPTKKGHGTLGGEAVSEGRKWDHLYNIAYRRFINDMNWLLMPLQILDSRVRRTYDGERTDSCGRTWDVVRLNWDASAGLTPGDIYWLWINRDTGVVEEWDTKAGTTQPEDAPIEMIFRDYRRVGGLLLSARREVKGKNQVMRFDDLKVLPEVPKGAFE